MTLSQLERAAAFLSIARVAAVLDMPRDTLWKRIKRGTPELSKDESERIEQALRQAGVRLVKN